MTICLFCGDPVGDNPVYDDNGEAACRSCGETELKTQAAERAALNKAPSVRQAALAIAYDFSVATDGEFGTNDITWAPQPSIARLLELYPDASLVEAGYASEACRAWAALKESNAGNVVSLPNGDRQ